MDRAAAERRRYASVVPETPSNLTPELPAVPTTRAEALSTALAALDALAELGETIEDEWSYVTALAEAGRARIRSATGPASSAALEPDRGVAVAAACAEVARITDPHRAIDWLSTFPAVVELALAIEPETAAPRPPASGGSTPPTGA